MGGVEGWVVRGGEGGREREDKERELNDKEIKEAIGKLKEGKAARVDEITGEV